MQIVLPLSVAASSVLLTILQEVLLMGLGMVVTADLYEAMVKHRVARGGAIAIDTRRSIVDVLPMNSDLPYQAGTKLHKLLATALRLSIFAATIMIGYSLDSIEVHEPIGMADVQLSVIEKHQPDRMNLFFQYFGTVKESCEALNGSIISYPAAIFNSKDRKFSCGSGTQAERDEIIRIRWKNATLPDDATKKVVCYTRFDHNLNTTEEHNDSQPICNPWGDCNEKMQFFEAESRVYLARTKPRFPNDDSVIEILEPRDFCVILANEVVTDWSSGVSRSLQLARSFSNHIVWKKDVRIELLSSEYVLKGTISRYGVILGAVTLAFVLTAGIFSYCWKAWLPFGNLRLISHAGIASIAFNRFSSESRQEIRFLSKNNDGKACIMVEQENEYPIMAEQDDETRSH